MMDGARHHDWALRQTAAFAAGLLDEASTERFEKHASECADCREEVDLLRAPEASRGQHLPDRLVSHWREEKSALRGLQRELVRRHLDACGECRAILKFRGHAPELERVPALEAAPEVLALLDAPAAPTERSEPRRVIELPVWRRRDFWLGSAFTGAMAAAAALVLVVNPGLHAPTEPAMAPMIQAIPPSPVFTPSIGSLPSAPPRWVSLKPIRLLTTRSGGSTDGKTLVLDESDRVFELVVEPPDVPEGSRVRVTIHAPDSTKLMNELHPVEDFFHGRPLVVHSLGRLVQGRYVLRISGRRDGHSESVDYRFDVRVRATRDSAAAGTHG